MPRQKLQTQSIEYYSEVKNVQIKKGLYLFFYSDSRVHSMHNLYCMCKEKLRAAVSYLHWEGLAIAHVTGHAGRRNGR